MKSTELRHADPVDRRDWMHISSWLQNRQQQACTKTEQWCTFYKTLLPAVMVLSTHSQWCRSLQSVRSTIQDMARLFKARSWRLRLENSLEIWSAKALMASDYSKQLMIAVLAPANGSKCCYCWPDRVPVTRAASLNCPAFLFWEDCRKIWENLQWMDKCSLFVIQCDTRQIFLGGFTQK